VDAMSEARHTPTDLAKARLVAETLADRDWVNATFEARHLMHGMADEIERLRARVAELEGDESDLLGLVEVARELREKAEAQARELWAEVDRLRAEVERLKDRSDRPPFDEHGFPS
jgi:polyhydroxyalkanoate synthesis regulator phasin